MRVAQLRDRLQCAEPQIEDYYAPVGRQDFVGADFVAGRKRHMRDLLSLLDQEAVSSS